MSVKDLRAAISLSRERLEEAYAYLLANRPLGQVVQRHCDELELVTAPEVATSIERYLHHDRPASLSKAALEVLSIIAYHQPITRSGIEFIRGSASGSALDYLGLHDLADLPPLPKGDE